MLEILQFYTATWWNFLTISFAMGLVAAVIIHSVDSIANAICAAASLKRRDPPWPHQS